jgi:predicted unusual protein kinase regulating ubiquinone biosynthesis (AarF/ABC1/UbiB family)
LDEFLVEPAYTPGEYVSDGVGRSLNVVLQIELVDFGATREYSKVFMDNWARLLGAAAEDDREGCVHWSLKLGYLTGDENEVRLCAACSYSILITGVLDNARRACAVDDDAGDAVQGGD